MELTTAPAQKISICAVPRFRVVALRKPVTGHESPNPLGLYSDSGSQWCLESSSA